MLPLHCHRHPHPRHDPHWSPRENWPRTPGCEGNSNGSIWGAASPIDSTTLDDSDWWRGCTCTHTGDPGNRRTNASHSQGNLNHQWDNEDDHDQEEDHHSTI